MKRQPNEIKRPTTAQITKLSSSVKSWNGIEFKISDHVFPNSRCFFLSLSVESEQNASWNAIWNKNIITKVSFKSEALMKQKNGRVVAKCMCKIGIGKDNKCAQQDSGKENHLATCFISSIIPFDSLSLAFYLSAILHIPPITTESKFVRTQSQFGQSLIHIHAVQCNSELYFFCSVF